MAGQAVRGDERCAQGLGFMYLEAAAAVMWQQLCSITSHFDTPHHAPSHTQTAGRATGAAEEVQKTAGEAREAAQPYLEAAKGAGQQAKVGMWTRGFGLAGRKGISMCIGRLPFCTS